MENTVYTLNQFAAKIGVTPQTLRTWHKEGRLTPAFITDGGHRRYTHKQYLEFVGETSNQTTKLNVGYVRVSSKKQSDDLTRQTQLMENYLIAKGKPFKIIQSVGSGINYKNPQLHELIRISGILTSEDTFSLSQTLYCLSQFYFDLTYFPLL